MKKITGNKLSDLQHLLSIDEMDIKLINDIFKSADRFLKNNQIIEKFIRLQPDQYLWVHRRFKNRPEGEDDLYNLPARKKRRRNH